MPKKRIGTGWIATAAHVPECLLLALTGTADFIRWRPLTLQERTGKAENRANILNRAM
jgi:hypothetical protein